MARTRIFLGSLFLILLATGPRLLDCPDCEWDPRLREGVRRLPGLTVPMTCSRCDSRARLTVTERIAASAGRPAPDTRLHILFGLSREDYSPWKAAWEGLFQPRTRMFLAWPYWPRISTTPLGIAQAFLVLIALGTAAFAPLVRCPDVRPGCVRCGGKGDLTLWRRWASDRLSTAVRKAALPLIAASVLAAILFAVPLAPCPRCPSVREYNRRNSGGCVILMCGACQGHERIPLWKAWFGTFAEIPER